MMKFRTLDQETLNENFAMMGKAASGDMVFKLDQTTAAPGAIALAADGAEYDVTIRLETAAGELHSWYNGKVLLAIADAGAGTATISPAAGERNMVNGVLTVKVSLDKAAWQPNETATLTVSDPETAGTGIMGWAVADKTFVATVADDS